MLCLYLIFILLFINLPVDKTPDLRFILQVSFSNLETKKNFHIINQWPDTCFSVFIAVLVSLLVEYCACVTLSVL